MENNQSLIQDQIKTKKFIKLLLLKKKKNGK